MTDTFIKQLTEVITECESVLSKSKFKDASDMLSSTEPTYLLTRCLAAIKRASGLNSAYHDSAIAINKAHRNVYYKLPRLIGVAKALLSDIQNGYLESFEELLHGDVFSDYLEMADYLLQKGYKDAAAVLAGSTLEIHIRKLCKKHGVETELNNKPKKADALNIELKKQQVYKLIDQKNITAWLSLRNNAAHGKYSEYDKNQVQLLVASIRDFLIRYPA